MNHDAMFFIVTGLIVVALVVAGPVYVLWQYQRGGTPAVGDRRQESPPMGVTSSPPQNPETPLTSR